MTEKSEMHELALGWVSFGAAVFPCRPADEDALNPATNEFENYKEKTPLITAGLNGASKKDNIIERWWRKFPNAIPGIPTGESAGFWVLDIDVPSDKHKEDGRIWLDAMTDEHGPLPATKTCQTANGGYQFFFRHVPGVKNRSGVGKDGDLGRGVDVRGEGGYIIAPGSIMTDGRFYDWVDNDSPVADAPQWLLDIVIGKTYAPKTTTGAGSTSGHGGDQARAYGLSVLESEAKVLASETEGGRGSAANTAAFTCGGLAQHCGLSATEIESALYAACEANGLVRKDGANKVLRDLKRQISAGMSKPRGAPDLKKSDSGLSKSVTISGLNKIAQKAKERASRPEWDQNEKDSYVEAANEEDEDKPRLYITPWDYSDSSEELEMTDTIMHPHLTRGLVSLTLAAGGTGKTTNTVAEVLSLVTGKDLLGFKPKRKYRVWWFNLEDPRLDLDKKIWGCINFYKLNRDDVRAGLFVDSGREQDMRVALAAKDDTAKVDEEIVGLIVEYIERNEIDVMVVDPFVSSHGVNENDNGAVDRVAKIWNQIAEYGGCAIELVHHIKKIDENKKRATSDDGRGAISLGAAARSIRVLNKMSEAEARDFGIHPSERNQFFVTNYEKFTKGKLVSADIWRKIESQSLGNSRKISVPHETVGVVTKWEKPEPVPLNELIKGPDRALILTNCKNQAWKYNPATKDAWVGHMIAGVLDLDPEGDKEKIRKLVDRMIAEKMLMKSEEEIPGRPKAQTFVRPAKGE